MKNSWLPTGFILLAYSAAALAQTEFESRSNEDSAQPDQDEIALEEWIQEVRDSPLVPRSPITNPQEPATIEEIFANGAAGQDEILEDCDVSDEFIAEADDMEGRLREMLDGIPSLPDKLSDLPPETLALWSQLTGLRAQEWRRCCQQSNRLCAF